MLGKLAVKEQYIIPMFSHSFYSEQIARSSQPTLPGSPIICYGWSIDDMLEMNIEVGHS
jgi:hypothetical protein